jgi:PAS domain S-box-containing protein
MRGAKALRASPASAVSVPATGPADPLGPWSALLEALPAAAWLVAAADGRVLLANREAAKLLGRSAEALVGSPARSLLQTPEDLAFWDEVAAGSADEGASLDSETTLQAPDGAQRHLRRQVRWLPVAPGCSERWLLVSVVDRTPEHDAESAHESVVAELRATLESTADGILVTDLAGRVRSFNRRFAQLWGIPETLLESGDACGVHDWMRRSVEDPDAWQQRWAATQEAVLLARHDPVRLHSGQVLDCVSRPLWQRGRPAGPRVQLSRPDPPAGRGEPHPRADRHRHADRPAQPAQPAPARLDAAAQRSRRNGASFALLLIDLDRFRQINDSLGHEVGDQVLKTVAQRIQGCMRQDDEIARMGGDQFAVLLHDADAAPPRPPPAACSTSWPSPAI